MPAMVVLLTISIRFTVRCSILILIWSCLRVLFFLFLKHSKSKVISKTVDARIYVIYIKYMKIYILDEDNSHTLAGTQAGPTWKEKNHHYC